MKRESPSEPETRTPASSDRLTERLALLKVTDQTFPVCVRSWHSLRQHRAALRKMASKYPLIISFGELRVVLEHPDQVDRLIADLRAKLKAWWLFGTATRAGELQ